MERNWDLVRHILLKLEQLGDTRSVLQPEDVPPYDAESVSYHIRLLSEGGLIEARCAESKTSEMRCWAFRMTWNGHEFLDRIRDQTVWNQVKSTSRQRGIALSFEVIKIAAGAVIGAVMKS